MTDIDYNNFTVVVPEGVTLSAGTTVRAVIGDGEDGATLFYTLSAPLRTGSDVQGLMFVQPPKLPTEPGTIVTNVTNTDESPQDPTARRSLPE